MAENRVVPEALEDTNYDVWSNCMKVYLLSQDLWDVIEPELEAEADESSSTNHDSKSWRRKNALALHAIHMSCGSAPLSEIGKLDSAKEAWDVLKSIDISHQQSHRDSDKDMVGDDHETVAKEQSDDSSDSEGDSSDRNQVVEEQMETIVEEQSSQAEDDVGTPAV